MWSEWPSAFTLSAANGFARDFPRLKPASCVNGISPATRDYNCFAWAAHATDRRWEPDPYLQYHWPDVAPREYSVAAFIVAYRSEGFEVCRDGSLEPETEKIAIYDIDGIVRHVARQLKNGNWTSKMGDYEDIQHLSLSSVSGPVYGDARTFMARKQP